MESQIFEECGDGLIQPQRRIPEWMDQKKMIGLLGSISGPSEVGDYKNKNKTKPPTK